MEEPFTPDPKTDRLSRSVILPCLGLLLLGVVVRIILVRSSLGPPDADESVVLLMARDMVHGHFETFYWGQEYGGSQEALLVAILARFGVPLRWGGDIVPISLSIVAAGLLWRIAKETVGAKVALLTAALYWSTPIAFVWLSQKERGFYEASAVSCLAVLLFATRLVRTSHRWDAIGLGLAFGCAIWSSPQSFYLLVPVGVWLTVGLVWSRRWHLLRLVPLGAIAAVVGGLPWLWSNARTGLASLHRPFVPFSTPVGRLGLYWRQALPQVTGFRLPYNSMRWMDPKILAVPHLLIVCLILLGAVLVGRRMPWVPLAIGWHPLMFAILPTSFYVSEARYLSLLWPTAALSLGYVVMRFSGAAGTWSVCLVCGLLCAVGCARLISFGHANPGAFDLEIQQASQVVQAIDRLGVENVFAEYWTSYTLEVASSGRVVASPLFTIRDHRRERHVRTANHFAYVLYSNGCAEKALNAVAASEGQGLPQREESGGPFVVVLPERPILPEDVVHLWAKERGRPTTGLPECAT